MPKEGQADHATSGLQVWRTSSLTGLRSNIPPSPSPFHSASGSFSQNAKTVFAGGSLARCLRAGATLDESRGVRQSKKNSQTRLSQIFLPERPPRGAVMPQLGPLVTCLVRCPGTTYQLLIHQFRWTERICGVHSCPPCGPGKKTSLPPSGPKARSAYSTTRAVLMRRGTKPRALPGDTAPRRCLGMQSLGGTVILRPPSFPYSSFGRTRSRAWARRVELWGGPPRRLWGFCSSEPVSVGGTSFFGPLGIEDTTGHELDVASSDLPLAGAHLSAPPYSEGFAHLLPWVLCPHRWSRLCPSLSHLP